MDGAPSDRSRPVRRLLVGLLVLAACGSPDHYIIIDEPPGAAIDASRTPGIEWIEGPVDVVMPPVRGTQVQVAETIPPPVTTMPYRWTGEIPEYGDRGSCTQERADNITRAFADAGASDETQTFFLWVASRESGCGNNVHFYSDRTRDDSYGWCQLNAKSGHFGNNGVLAGWDRNLILTDFTYNTMACRAMWLVCGRGPWQPPYSCREPTS
jgi:hypothetical protein